MNAKHFPTVLGILLITAIMLLLMGRDVICSCGYIVDAKQNDRFKTVSC